MKPFEADVIITSVLVLRIRYHARFQVRGRSVDVEFEKESGITLHVSALE